MNNRLNYAFYSLIPVGSVPIRPILTPIRASKISSQRQSLGLITSPVDLLPFPGLLIQFQVLLLFCIFDYLLQNVALQKPLNKQPQPHAKFLKLPAPDCLKEANEDARQQEYLELDDQHRNGKKINRGDNRSQRLPPRDVRSYFTSPNPRQN